MNFRKIITVYRKEVLDLMRDRRTIITSFVVPIILYPLIMIGFSSMMSRQETKLDNKPVDIIVSNLSQQLEADLLETALLEVDKANILPEAEDNLAELKAGNIHAIVTIKDTVDARGFKNFKVLIQYNRTDDLSEQAYNRLRNTLSEIENDLIGNRLAAINIDAGILEVIDLESENIAPPERMLGFGLGRFLPYLLITMILSSGAAIASDLIAGEKERGTLETILVSAASRLELVTGKYLTVITFSFITVILNLLSMFISLKHIMGQSGMELTGIQLPWTSFALILISLIPLISLFAALLVSISTYSRNNKEAQSYFMPLMFGGMMLAMISMLPGFDLTYGFAVIPVVNFSLLFKNIMMGDFLWGHFITVFLSTFVLDVVAIYISFKLFNSESILFRTAEEKSMKFWGKHKTNVFSTQIVMLFYVVALLLLFYVGSSWQAANINQGLLKTQLILIFLPAMFMIRMAKLKPKEGLNYRGTKPANFALAALMAIPAIVVAAILGQLINTLFPISESYLEAMGKVISGDGNSIWMTLFIVAVLPGICEETMFRGYIINGFRKYGFWAAAIASGVLFGIFHLDMFRLLPASLLGIYLGYMLLKTNSIYLTMFAHFLNNGIAILLANYGDKLPFMNIISDGENFRYWMIIPALGLFILFIRIFDKSNKYGSEIPEIYEG